MSKRRGMKRVKEKKGKPGRERRESEVKKRGRSKDGKRDKMRMDKEE